MPKTSSGSAIEVHTLRYGGTWWIKLCAPSLGRWCKVHGHKLRVWGKSRKYPAAKFRVVDMLAEFLAGKSDWFIHMDADIYVDAGAGIPNVRGGMYATVASVALGRPTNAGPCKGDRDFRRWFKTHYKKKVRNWKYRNTGVWMCDRTAASQLLEVIKEPFITGYQEQHQLNAWFREAEEAGMTLSELSSTWNDMGIGVGRLFGQGTNFYHLAGANKSKRLPSLIERFKSEIR